MAIKVETPQIRWERMRYYLDRIDSSFKEENAQRFAFAMLEDFDQHKQNIGEENAQILLAWIHSKGVGKEKPKPNGWGEVFRLLFRYWKEKREDFQILDLFRMVVWSLLGFREQD